MLTMKQISKILTDHRYYDKANDIYHSLKQSEIDALCSYFETCQTDQYCNKTYICTVADNVIRKRI